MKDTKTTVAGLALAIALAMLAVPDLPPWAILTLKLTGAIAGACLGFFAKDAVPVKVAIVAGACVFLIGCATPPWLHLKVSSPAFGSVEFGLHPGATRGTNTAQPSSLP